MIGSVVRAQIGLSEPDIRHFRFCKVLIFMAFGGGALAEIGPFLVPAFVNGRLLNI